MLAHIMALFVLLALLASPLLAAAAPAPPPLPGYIVTAQFNCVDAGCGDWELDITRVDTTFRFKNFTLRLATLIPKSPVESMSFPVFTAYHEPSRIYYVAGIPTTGNGMVWGYKIANDVSSAESVSSAKFALPEDNGNVVGMHATANGTLVVLFDHGQATTLDPASGKLTLLKNVLANGTYTDGHVLEATGYDVITDRLFGIVTDQYSSDWAVATLDVNTLALSVQKLTSRQRERFGAEIFVDALWVPNANKLAVFLQAVSPLIGFDQVAMVDPPTGDVTLAIYNLFDNLVGFECTPSTKDCDRHGTACYNSVDKKVYFQAHKYMSQDDDIGATSIQMSDLSPKFPIVDEAIDPFSFGYMGFQYVVVVSE